MRALTCPEHVSIFCLSSWSFLAPAQALSPLSVSTGLLMIRALSVELDGFQFFPALLFFSEELILYANIYHFRSFSSPFSFEYRPRRENSAGYIGIGGFIFFVWIGLDDFK